MGLKLIKHMATIKTSSGQTVTTPDGNVPGMTYETAKQPPVTKVSTPAEVKQSETPALEPTPVQEGQTFSKEKIGGDIKNTLAADGIMDKTANRAFLDAATRYSQGRNATTDELASGMTVRQATEKYGLGDLAPTHGIDTTPPQINTQPDTINNADPDPVSAALDKLIAIKQGGIGKQADVNAYLVKKQEAAMDVEKARQTISDKKLLDAEHLKTIGDRPIAMAFINRQKAGYNTAQYITDLKMAQDYNNKLILSKMADGNFMEAQRINKDISNDNYEIAKLQIEKARNEQVITDKEAERLDKEADYQRGMAENGYLYISDPKMLEGMKEADIYRDPVSGRIYKKPVAEVEDKMLSISEAKSLNVPFGTTTSQAVAMGINPAQVAMASKASGGGSSDKIKQVELSTADKKRLIGAGIKEGDINAIWDKVKSEGIGSVVSEWDDTQAQVLLDVVNGVTVAQRAKIEKDYSDTLAEMTSDIKLLIEDGKTSVASLIALVEDAGLPVDDFKYLWDGYTPDDNSGFFSFFK